METANQPEPLSAIISNLEARERWFMETIVNLQSAVKSLSEENSMLKEDQFRLEKENEKLNSEIKKFVNVKNEFRLGDIKFKSPTLVSPKLSSTPNMFKNERLSQPKIKSTFKVPSNTIDLLGIKKATPSKISVKINSGTPNAISDESLATTVDPGESVIEGSVNVEPSPNDSLASTVDSDDIEVGKPADDEDSLPPTYNPDVQSKLIRVGINSNDSDDEPPRCAHHCDLRNEQNLKPCAAHGIDDSYDVVPTRGNANENCVEVVRQKARRRQLAAGDCAECCAYYAAVGGEHRQVSSRHRANQFLPPTPDGFWDLSWRETNNAPHHFSQEGPEQDDDIKDGAFNNVALKRRRQPFRPPERKAKLRQTVDVSQEIK